MWRLPFFIVIGWLMTGCHVSSKLAMYGSGGRTSYNIAAQNTTNQELLLNLVRLRYSDTPYFLELNNITTQFTFNTTLIPTIPIPGFTKKNPAELEGQFSWQNQPTIQYSPLEGKDFAVQLMYPLDLQLIQGLVFTGWDVDRVFRLLVQNMAEIPNACSASGPMPKEPPHYKKFLEVVHLLRVFQREGKLQIGIRYIPRGKTKPIAQSDEPEDTTPNAIQITFPSTGEEAERLGALLHGLKMNNGNYILNMRQAFNEKAEIGIMTRSLLSCMYYLSLGVEVPKRDIEAGVVAVTKYENGDLFDWRDVIGDMITVHSSPSYPQEAYLAVHYKGYWFYIANDDIEAKRTFVLLQQIYSLQAKRQEKEAPLLSIPLGV
ncbi:MAG: hypothetical protein AAF443_03565 [Chlamydiota bacterium]